MKILIIANYIKNKGGISSVVYNHLIKIKSENYFVDIFNTKKKILLRLFLIFPLLYKIKKYDVIHIHGCSYLGFFPIVIGVISGKLFYNKKVIVTYHGGEAEPFLIQHHKFVKMFLRRADYVTVMSEFFQNTFNKYGIKTVVLPNLLDIESQKNLYFDYSVPKLVSIRYLDKIYNIQDIIEAYGLILSKYNKAELKIIGDGPEQVNLLEYCKNNGLVNVKFLGKIPHDQIPKELMSSNIFVSVPSFDNQPMSILEAYANRIVVISSRVGGIPEIVQDGITGFLVDVNEPKQIMEKVEWILINPTKARAIAENANNELVRFRWNEIGPQLLNLYEN